MLSPREKRLIRRVLRHSTPSQEDYLQQRAVMAEHIRGCSEDGRIAIVTAGMDCDGSAWANRVSLVDAVPRKVEHYLERYYAEAEGPQSHELARPSQVADLHAVHRDLAMEAYEDGHPHSLHYGQFLQEEVVDLDRAMAIREVSDPVLSSVHP